MSVESLNSELVLRWKIENFSLKKGRLESPQFYFMNADWCVEIFLKDMCLSRDQIKIGFRQLTNENVTANWSWAFLNSKDLLIHISEKINTVNNGKSCGACTWILKYDDKFNASNLPNDILSIACRIWTGTRPSHLPQQADFKITSLLPRTDFEKFTVVTEKIFCWEKDFYFMDIRQIVEQVEPMMRNKVLKIKLYKETEQRLILILEMPACTVLEKYKIYLTKQFFNYLEFSEDQFKSDNSKYFFYLNFTTSIPRIVKLVFLLAYYHNDTEETFASNSFESVLPTAKPISSIFGFNPKFSVGDQPNTIMHKPQSRQPPPTDSPSTIFQDLRSIYEEGFLSDFSLRVQDKNFPVHKVILGARSSVFRAMFTSDMKEKESGHVDIPDVDASTIQRMLNFIYWDNVDKDMQWKSACSLYSAADKYALESLKQRCSSRLRATLSATSVLDVLQLSDTHQDKVLKAAALDFISKNDKGIIGTELWNKFTEEHGPLALEILQQLYLKKMVV